MEKSIVLDDSLKLIDDDRIEKLFKNEMTVQDFMKSLKGSEPYRIRNGKLCFISQENLDTDRQKYIANRIAIIKHTGGITRDTLDKYHDRFLKVYGSAYGALYNDVQKRINHASCSNCQASKEYKRLIEYVVTEKNADITPLVDVLDDNMLKALRQEEINITADDIQLPAYVQYNYDNIKYKDNVQVESIVERDACPDCFEKHVSQAIIQLKEVLQGYQPPEYDHYFLALGHLAEASDEIVAIDAELANKIRQVRLELMQSYQINIKQKLSTDTGIGNEK